MKRTSLYQILISVFVVVLLGLTLPRFVVFPSLCLRPFECLIIHRQIQGPFRPNAFVEKPAVCGDLANLANEPKLCDFRPEAWQTDPWGYRNDQAVWSAEPETVIFGDSFAFGEGTTQTNDPAHQLAGFLNQPVYNAGGKFELNYLRWLFEHRRHPPKELVYFYLERHMHDQSDLKDWNKVINDQNPLESFKIFWGDLVNYNPLKIAAAHFDKTFLTPGLWPNRYKKDYPTFHLLNDKPILFLPISVVRYGNPRIGEIQGEVDFFTGLQKLCAQQNVHLTVLLIPEKYSVYAPLLKDPAPAETGQPAYLDEISQALSENKVDNLNLLPVFKSEAAAAFKENNLIYWPDDTHWNPAGIKIAMKQLADYLTRK